MEQQLITQKLPGMRVGGEVEGAEGVALAGHVLPQKVSRPVHLQVRLQVRLLLEGRLETSSFTFLFFRKLQVLHLIFQEISCFTFDFQEPSLWQFQGAVRASPGPCGSWTAHA